MAASHVESWKDERIHGHQFRGVIDDSDLSLQPQEVIERVKRELSCEDVAWKHLVTPQEVIERVKRELVSSIVKQLMTELGPLIDEAITQAWRENST